MRKIAFIVSFLLLLALASSASAIGIRGALVLCNSNYSEKYEGSIKTVDLNMHYGLEVNISYPISPMIEILGGLTYYLPVSGKLGDTGYYPDDEKIGFLPINLAAKFNIPAGMTGMKPYAGLGLNYTNWYWDPTDEVGPSHPGLGYYGFVGAEFGSIFGELGYTIMTTTLSHWDSYSESRGIYIKGGMIFGL